MSLPPITPEKNVNPFAITSGKKKLLSMSLRSADDDKKMWERSNNQVLSRTERLALLVGKDVDTQATTQVNILSDSTISNLKNSDKESISDLITKKREMFLVQMSLDTKREEIRKLEEKAHLKEDALQRSEQMLEEDAVRFDAFLKENDKKAHDAIKQAEEETRKKQEKLFEIKRLTQQIQQLNSEIIKNKETLDECLKYKLFLDDLTPQHLQDDTTTTSHEEESHQFPSMYFTKTSQLMDIFAALEEQNLFLIQNSQETESTLEELQLSYTQTKISMENQSFQLNQQIEELKGQIDREKHRTEILKRKRLKSNEAAKTSSLVTVGNVSNNEQQQQQEEIEEEKLLKELNKKVENVYQQCGFDSSSRPTTIFMLAQLESRLENLLTDINQLPQEFVLTSEKAKEKRRREKKREEQQELFIQQQDERNRKAIERSLQAPKKKTGRVIMYRSRLVNNNETKKCEVMSSSQIDELKFMT